MSITIGVDTVKLAGLQIDLLQKVRQGNITLEHLEWFNNLSKEQRDTVSNVSKTTELTKDSFKIWKTIKLGTGLKTAKDFRKALKKSGNRIGDWGDDILGTDEFQHILDNAHSGKMYDEIELCCASVKELTGRDGAEFSEIKTAIQRVGKLCQPWMGPLLRMNYLDQPKGERLRIAMGPITGSGGDLPAFYIVHDGHGRWLHGSLGHPDDFCIGVSFVFRSK